nr:reverse transcriptase domain-containing protein [Tanacetum cinerariifolium]
MYYPWFTNVVIHHFISKDPSIPKRNKVNWHYVRDDYMFYIIKLVSKHQNTQPFSALLPIELTNEEIRNFNAYKEYYAIATGAAQPKPKASVRRTRSSSDTSITPPTAATSSRLIASTKGKQTAKASKAKSLPALSENSTDDECADNERKDGDDDEEDEGDDGKEGDGEGNGDEDIGLNIGGKKDTLKRKRKMNFTETMLNLTLDLGMESIFETTSQMDVPTPTSMAPLPMTAPTMTLSTIATITTTSQAPILPTTVSRTIIQNLPNFGSLFYFDDRLRTLEANLPEFMQTNQFARAVSAIPEIVQRYMDQQMNEAVKVAIQIQSNRLHNEAQRENDEFLKTVDENIQKIIKEQVKEQVKHPEWFSQQQKPPSPDCDWNKTVLAFYGSIQPWISELAKRSDSRSSFNELMDTPLDFTNFLINRLKVDTLTPELLTGPTYELMKGSCKSLVELEYHLEEVFKATTDQLDWVNPEEACGRRSIGSRKIPEEAQPNKPDSYRSDLKRKEAYTTYSNLRGFIYQNKDKKNRLMRIDELHKFSDGTLIDVRIALDDHLIEIRMQSILKDLQVTPTKPGRMTKPYSSHRFIANCFNVRNIKKKVKVPDYIFFKEDYEEDPKEEPKEEPEEDVNIKLEDDVELIFLYEVEGDKTLPPRDVSSVSVSSDSESEDEEVYVTPEATVGTITQKPYVIRDFLRGLFEVRESSSAHDSSNVDGLASWALRRDLEASRARAKVMEAELGTCQTEIALLKSKDRIREKERELLNHDLENVEHAMGNVLERVSILESGENATLKKRLAETETKLVWAHMVRIGAVLKSPSEDEDTEHPRKKSKNSTSDGTEGPSEPRGPPSDSYDAGAGGVRASGAEVDGAGAGGAEAGGDGADGAGAGGAGVGGTGPAAPKITGVCKERDKVKFATATRQGRILTWWNGRIASMGIDTANGTNIDGYTNRFHELALLYPRIVEPEQVKVEQYVRGLSKNIRGDVTSSRPAGIDEAVRMAYQLMRQIIQDKTDEVSEGEKRKGADKSFVSTNFSTLIDIEPVELDTSYKVKLVDGKVVSTNNVLIGCTLNLLNRSFPIDLMVIELGSFDIIIGMDWLSRYDAAILYGEKKVRIPLEGESSHWQYKFPLPVEGVPTAKRMEIPLLGVCTAAVLTALAQNRMGRSESASIVLAASIRVLFFLSAMPFCSGVLGIQSNQEEFEFMAAADADEETERVKVNCTSEDTLLQASTSGTQSDNATVYDSDGSTEELHSQAKEKGCCLSSDTAVDCSKGRGRNPTSSLRQASSSGTQTDSAPVYDSDGSAEVHESYDNNEIFNMFTQEEQYTELLEPIPESHLVPQNDNEVISKVTGVEQDGETVEQHPTNFKETRALYESLYQNLAVEVEKVNSVNRKLKETNADLTTELARYKNQKRCFEISQEKYDKLERCYQKSVYQEQCLSKKINALHLSTGKQIMTLNEQISDLNKQLSKEKSTVSFLLEEKKKLKSDFKTYEDKLLDKQIELEKKIKDLNNIVFKTGQSIQTINMLSPKPDSFYHTEQKMALGCQNPFYLKQAQKKQQSLYDGKVLLAKHDPIVVHDSKETLQLAQESRQKIKQINKDIKQANYMKINHLSGVFVPQSALSHEELYFSNISKTANVSKSISIPNEDLSDDTTPSVARKFLNEVKSTIVTLQRVVKQRMTIETHNWASSAHQEFYKIEADSSLAKHKILEFDIECLLKAVVSQDIISIMQNASVVDTSDL